MVIDFYNFCREVCSVVIEKKSEHIGGPGKAVEIDESKFGKRKYNHGEAQIPLYRLCDKVRDKFPTKSRTQIMKVRGLCR